MKFGGNGKFPLRFGGDPSPQEKAYAALRTLEGTGFGPVDDVFGDQTLDGAWLRAMASAMGALATFGESAIYQAFPTTASDLLPEYERILNLAPPVSASNQARRNAIVPKWIGNIKSAFPDLIAGLDAIDARYTVQAPNHTLARVSTFGKVFDPQSGAHQFRGGKTISDYPVYSDDHIVNALLNVGEGIPATGLNGIAKTAGEALLTDSLPAWCDYNVFLDLGFTLDRSLLDVTALT